MEAPAMQKPPTILVYTNDQQDLYHQIRDHLSTVIPSDVYTVFHISKNVIRKQHWMDTSSVCLLIMDSCGLDDLAWENILSYSDSWGKIIFVLPDDVQNSHVEALQATAVFCYSSLELVLAENSQVLRDALVSVGIHVLENTSAPPPLTQGYIQMKEDGEMERLNLRFNEELGFSTPKIVFRKGKEESGMIPSEEVLPIEVKSSTLSLPSFDSSLYFSSLLSHRLGRLLVYVPVTTSTMDVCKSLLDAIPNSPEVCVVARQQTKGRGRGGNEFLSPPGTASFTFSCTLPRGSQLGSHPSFVQHVVAVSVVEAVVELSGLETFPLRIKWPNDFYYNRTQKVGGLMATASFCGDSIALSFGVGLNVCNSRPTVCLNQMLPEGSKTLFTVEEVIAGSLSKLEANLALYELRGQDIFLKKYYEYWLHKNERVQLESERGKEKVVISGLEENGFLLVKSEGYPKEQFSVSDNGNSFNMMEGLIKMKLG